VAGRYGPSEAAEAGVIRGGVKTAGWARARLAQEVSYGRRAERRRMLVRQENRMGRSNNVNRPFVRSSRHAQATGEGASGLRARAGMTERPSVEQLERRQMLFALTISADSVDPNTGLGSANAFFHYYLPYLATSQTFTDVPVQTSAEGFDQENYGPIGSGRVMAESGLEFRHNINPAGDISIASATNTQDDAARWVRIDLNETGEFFAMRFRADGSDPASPRISVRSASFEVAADPSTVGDVSGLLVNRLRADLLLGDQVIASFTGDALRQLITVGTPQDIANGRGVFRLQAPASTPAFDELRFTMLTPPSANELSAFIIDNVSFDRTPDRYASLMSSRAFGAAVALTGPVGATVNFRDLYGRPMLSTLAGIPAGSLQTNPGDPDDNGVPNRNDGIGSIRFSGTDSRTSFMMIGGTLGTSTTRPDGFDPNALIPRIFWDGTYTLTLTDDLLGLYGDFETAGFGFAAEARGATVVFTGLPPGSGSVIVGSPFVRDNSGGATSYNPEGFAEDAQGNPIFLVTSGFTRSDQGLFLEDGSSIGSLTINGMLFGASKFNGFVDRVSVGNLMGSLTVAGDLGSLVVAADAGIWSPDPGFGFQTPGRTLDQNNKTSALVVVGRTLGQVLIGGRSQLDVTVGGDLNSPTTKPQRDSTVYYEIEAYSGVGPTAARGLALSAAVSNVTLNAQDSQAITRSGGQPVVFGDNYFRNDSILSAEIINSQSSMVRIKGELSQRDPYNGDDEADVYGFAVTGGETINFQATVGGITSPYIRVLDSDGVVVAAPESSFRTGRFVPTLLNFKPDAPGIYYLVVMDPNGADAEETGAGGVAYSIAVTGLATATLGAYRTGAGQGLTDLASGEGSSVTVLSGNIGSIRLGTAFLASDGTDTSPIVVTNTTQNVDDAMSWQGGSISTPGSIFNITTGSDIGQPVTSTQGNPTITVSIGGDLGTLVTGLSPLLAGPGSGRSGDVNLLNLDVGGRIGMLDIRGGVGVDQDFDPRVPLEANTFNVRTGLSGREGSVGAIRVAFHVASDAMNLTTPAGSTIGALLVSQHPAAYIDASGFSGIFQGLRGIRLNTGSGSDVRFADVPRIDLLNSLAITTPIIGGQTVEIIDDGGAAVSISINGPVGQVLGQVISIPVDGSQGVAIAAINANLAGGLTLTVSGRDALGAGVISIGRISAAGDGASSINISGSVEVDVWRIDERNLFGGEAGQAGGFASIVNTTPSGDIVAIDVLAVAVVSVDGDLGRTQVPAFGPRLLGPRLGIANGLQADVGGAIGTAPGLYDTNLAANKLLRAIRDSDQRADQASRDDIGSPVDLDLNGLIVRSGNVQQVRARGAVGDVILQGAAGVVQVVTANYDLQSLAGRFEGIVGTIYADTLVRVEVGDGIARPSSSPLASSGIFAANNILDVTSLKTDGRVLIEGPISASNRAADVSPLFVDGINSVIFTNADIRDAYIGVRDLDGYWQSFLYGDDNRSRGDLGEVRLLSGNVYASTIVAADVRTFTLAAGFFDASNLGATGELGVVTATGYRNSTLTGSLDELRPNIITGARDAQRITATGEMNDLRIDIIGRVRQSIDAANISRSVVDVDGELASLFAAGGIRGTSVTAGQLSAVSARDYYASVFVASGAINTFTATNTIANTRIEVTGPGGSIGAVTSANGIVGEIIASGPIGSVTATAGDIDGLIATSTGRGNVGTVTAGRDLLVRTDVSGNIAGLVAGRNIGVQGRPASILVRGDLGSLSAPAGSLYSDLRVGGAITTGVSLGGAVAKPADNRASSGSIVAFGSVKSVAVAGDFGGDIISHSGGIASVAITNGSFLPGRTIAAYDGSIASLIINNGNLYGNVHADVDITLLSVVAGADGVFGDVGVNPAFSSAAGYDDRRNRVPPGIVPLAAAQGPSISAGRAIVKFDVTGGDVFETSVRAGRAITAITIAGSVGNDALTSGFGSSFAAGDVITSITIRGDVSRTRFVAGLVDLGADNALGGTLLNADTIKSGSIALVAVTGRVSDSTFSAGMNAGVDGVYNTADDTTAIGISAVNTLTFGSVGGGVSVFGDTLSAAVASDNRFGRGGTDAPHSNALIQSAATVPPGGVSFNAGSRTFAVAGGTVTITLAGPGTANFNAAATTLRLVNTTTASSVTIVASSGSLADFDVVGNDDAALGTLSIAPTLTGDSDIAIDGGVTTLTLGRLEGTGHVYVGGDVATLTLAALLGGFLELRSVATLTVNGQFGATNPLTLGEASISALSLGAVGITGASRGLISVDREIASVAAGSFERALLRAGLSIGPVTAASIRTTILSAGDAIGTLAVAGEVFDSAFLAGLDLGADGTYGGTGLRADRLSTGTVAAVSVGGSFLESDIIAGFARGADGFFGTSDDSVAPGRSSISTVVIGGSGVGSSRATESYRIASSGSVGTIRVGGLPFQGSRGNFAVETPLLAPDSGRVADIRTSVESRVFTANIIFNQPIDFASLRPSLSVSEVRGSGDIEIRLIDGLDYFVSYDQAVNTARVVFSRSITDRNLPAVPDKPGPGVYRFLIDEALFRTKLSGQSLDGNGDSLNRPGDDFSQDVIIGDAGDKVAPVVTTVPAVVNGSPASYRIDFYGATNLDFVLDSNTASDNLPDVNRPYILRGFIGDHADHDTSLFRFAGDVDVYAVTLQAGQILRLGKMEGTGSLASRALYDSLLAVQATFGNASDSTNPLPPPPGLDTDTTFPDVYLIQRTGTYYIAIGTVADLSGTGVSNPDQSPLRVGDYSFSVEVFDDGDSGFTSPTDSGDGTRVVNAPPAEDFAGLDGVLGTADDLASIVTGGFVFTRDAATNSVGGTNAAGIVSAREASGRLVSTISAAIGPRGRAGIPSASYASDVDVFHLNNRLPIAPGTKLKITVKLSQFGSDLGSASPDTFTDNRGSVQFGFFDTSLSSVVDDATLVFSPSDFLPYGGVPNTTIADDGVTRYGYDANGDFFIDFVVPPGPGGTAGTFAAYLQGVYNTDYQLEVVTQGSGAVTPKSQNVYIETRGGSLDWLQVGGVSTELAGLDLSTLGFTGVATNGQGVDDYFVQRLLAGLNSLFQGAGYGVTFSTNSADFEFQPFSTVYLSRSSDPITPLFSAFSGAFNFDLISQNFNSVQPYGFSRHVDPFNVDLEDDAVVFVPAFAIQAITPGQSGLDQLTQAVTGAVARRVGELMGLRVTDVIATTATSFDPMAANAPENLPGAGRAYSLSNTRRRLSTNFDGITNTNFFLGNQNAVSLLDQVLARR
jgi:hypothetical protein